MWEATKHDKEAANSQIQATLRLVAFVSDFKVGVTSVPNKGVSLLSKSFMMLSAAMVVSMIVLSRANGWRAQRGLLQVARRALSTRADAEPF